MNDNTKQNGSERAEGQSRLNDGLGKVTVKDIGDSTFEAVNGGSEPLFKLDNHGYYWHQSGYGCLSPERIIVVPNV